MHRRRFLQTSCLASVAMASSLRAEPVVPRIRIALKCGMAAFGKNLEEKFRILKEIGYDGVELDSPGGQDKAEALAASKATGLPIHGVVDSIHWTVRCSDPAEEVREKALQGLLTAIRESHTVGGSAVLLVPGVVDGKTSHDEAVERSIPVIQRALPLAAELGIRVLIENVWNKMFYDENGGDAQGAERLAAYLDRFDSPWVGSYFDIGNHRKFGKPEEWIRTLGKRIVKLDGKDWSREKGWVDLGEGDIDWPAVRAALAGIGYTGWATAEVKGGDRDRCAKVLEGMRRCLLGA
ncbi:sugar phosphate isomerase/epimerase family protein [Luteolibacter sp. LG18]|uniref:sugar phosphate isomerase/epimerase family protein n=1 Tax=Luteolibacter sp. LG18 TaxID=2819286 RepID=UPI002B2F3AA7|nr:xylose isomerase [Luteolibacter sp. LG18]